MISCIKNLPVPECNPESSLVLLSSSADLGDSTVRTTTRGTLRLSSASPGSKASGKGDGCQGLAVRSTVPLWTTTGPDRNTGQLEALSPTRSHFELRREGAGGPLSAWLPSYPPACEENCSFTPLLTAPLCSPALSLFPFHIHTCTPHTA